MSKKSEKTEKIEKKESSFINKELWGMVLIASSAFLFLCLVTGDNLFSPVGKWLQGILLGFSGFFSFPLLLFAFFCGFMIVIGRKIENGKGKLNAAPSGKIYPTGRLKIKIKKRKYENNHSFRTWESCRHAL